LAVQTAGEKASETIRLRRAVLGVLGGTTVGMDATVKEG
jgi:hypothetical protein